MIVSVVASPVTIEEKSLANAPLKSAKKKTSVPNMSSGSVVVASPVKRKAETEAQKMGTSNRGITEGMSTLNKALLSQFSFTMPNAMIQVRSFIACLQ